MNDKDWESLLEINSETDSMGRRSRLAVRIANVFHNYNLGTKDEVKDAFVSGRLNPKGIRNYGNKSHSLVAAWLGLPLPDKPVKLCPHCGFPL